MTMPDDPSFETFAPAHAEELSQFLIENPETAVYPIGGGTVADQSGEPSRSGIRVRTEKISGIRDYPAADMTITLAGGTPLAELQEITAQHGQRLPVDHPAPARATIGGFLAANLNGSRRFGYGTLRDYLLGFTAVDGTGRLFSAGGRVVKNVAGYDINKLMIGSWGTLGILTEVTLKLRPIPESTALCVASFSENPFEEVDQLLEALMVSDLRPVAMDVLTPAAASRVLETSSEAVMLCVLFEGFSAEVEWQCETFTEFANQVLLDDFRKVPNPAAEQHTRSISALPVCCRIAEKPSAAVSVLESIHDAGFAGVLHAGDGIISAFPGDGENPTPSFLQFCRKLEKTEGKTLRLFQESPVFREGDLHRRLRSVFDPKHRMNPRASLIFTE